ncbi:MAG: hypothetical protein ACK501_00380 [Planctomycetota bacterium]|jgi:hypothetical protein
MTPLRLVSFALLGATLAAQQQVTLPDNHYFSESNLQLNNVGTTAWWRPTAGRMQILYEGSNFTGVTGPIFITKIKFRGEDGEINLGGQVYTGVNVAVGSTSVTNATMTNTFANNLAPTLPATTTMGTTVTTNVTVAPSVGSMPNNWNIEIDLVALGGAIAFDPTSSEPNFLIDITMPNAPSNAAPLSLIAMANTTGGSTFIRGAGVTTATPGSATGTLSSIPLIVGVEFAGTGGFNPVVVARNEVYGGACGGSASSFYQAFLNGQQWDLNSGLTLTPDNPTAPTFYTVSTGAPAFDATKVNATANSIADDALVTHALGFTHAFPGGSTSTVVASTNGFVWLDPTMNDNQFAGVVSRLLGDPVTGSVAPIVQYSGGRYALYWHDLNMSKNLTLNPQAGLHVLTDTSGGPGNAVAYVTWRDVAEFNTVGPSSGVTPITGHTIWNFQCVIYEATGVVEFRYGSMPQFTTSSGSTLGHHAAIVGFSQGRLGGLSGVNSVDPQSRDLSIEPAFTTSPEGSFGNIGQTAVTTPVAGGVQYNGRLFAGQTVAWNANNVPPGSLLGVQFLDIAAVRPGIQFPTITAPGCMISLTPTALAWETFVLPGANVTGSVTLTIPAGLDGVDLHAQFLVLDGLFGGPNLVTSSSNAIRHTIGQN